MMNDVGILIFLSLHPLGLGRKGTKKAKWQCVKNCFFCSLFGVLYLVFRGVEGWNVKFI